MASFEHVGQSRRVENVLVKVYGEGTEITIDRKSNVSEKPPFCGSN